VENKTTEFSFILKPAEHGIGVFATHDIKKGTFLRLFGNEGRDRNNSVRRKKKDVPTLFHKYCVDRGEQVACPADFGHMEIGWHLNHSRTPNTYHKNYHYYSSRDINEGEEITVDYNTLEEPEESKESYY
jgi:SET domain-containing protein